MSNVRYISVTILSKNSEKFIEAVLNALSAFDEVILYDTQSTDRTVELASRYANVKIIRASFEGFGPTHNAASACAKNDWILSVDSDEVVTAEMVDAINEVELLSNAVYSFPRHNYFNQKFIKWCGWYPDRQVRLYNRLNTHFTNEQVHEAIISKGMLHVALKAPMIHYSYTCLSDFIGKMQTYSTLFAQQYCGKKKSSLTKALLHGAFAFFKSLILKRGFLGGYEGFVISAYNAHTAYYKYLKLYEANCELEKK